MDDLYTAAAAIRQPAPASCWEVVHRRLAGVDDDYTARAAIRQPAPAGCGVVAHHLPSRKFYCILATAWQPAVGCCAPTIVIPQATRLTALYLHHIPHWGAHQQPCLGRSHTLICSLDKPPPLLRVEGGPAPSWRGLPMGSLRGAWRN